jgi:hypothetical protein
MAAIVEVSGSRRLQLGNEEFTRTFRFGPKWTKIKIGMTLGINGVQNFTARPMLGACSGSVNGFNAPLTDGFLGLCPVAFTGTPLAYVPFTFTNGTGNKHMITRIGSTVVDTLVSSSSVWCAAAAPDHLSMWIVTIIKTSWNVMTISMAATNAASAALSIPDFVFYKNMENEAGTSYQLGLSNDDSIGTTVWTGPALDSMSFSWDHVAPSIEIGHVGVVRFQ